MRFRFFIKPIIFLLLFGNCHFEKKPDTLHFSYYKGLLVFKGLVNEKYSAKIIFDTGAHGLGLDSGFIETNKIINESKVPYKKGKQVIFDAEDSLNLQLFGQTFVKRPLIWGYRVVAGDSIDGIVGWDLLEEKSLYINYISRTAAFINSPEDSLDKNYLRIPFEIIEPFYKNEKLIVVPLEIEFSNKTIRGNYVLDLGYSGSVYLTRMTAEMNQIAPHTINRIAFEGKGLSGRLRGYDCRIKSVGISKFRINNPIIEISTDSNTVLSGHPLFDGLIGNSFFERFDLILDFKNSNLYLKPNFTLNYKFYTVRKNKYIFR